MAKKGVRRIKKKRVRLSFNEGIAYIHSSFNNTIVTLADRAGNTLTWSSGGKIGYKGSKKSTPFAAQLAAEEVAKAALDMGINKVNVVVKGPGGGREGEGIRRPPDADRAEPVPGHVRAEQPRPDYLQLGDVHYKARQPGKAGRGDLQFPARGERIENPARRVPW